MPAFTNPINKGTAKQEQKGGVIVPKSAAPKYSFRPLTIRLTLMVRCNSWKMIL